MSIRRAAEAFGVPKSMLSDHIKGNVTCGARSGPSTYLSDSEELELVQFLAHCTLVGNAKSKQEVLAIVRYALVSKQLKNAIVTVGWWSSFKKRHGMLTLRVAEQLSYKRVAASSPEIIESLF